MLSETELLAYVESQLSEQRYAHTIRVLTTAIKIATNLEVDLEALKIACITHDMTKEDMSWTEDMMREIGINDEQIIAQTHVWHGFTSAYRLKNEFGIKNEQILDAVRYHTIGSPDFDLVGKVLYIADYIEPNRKQARNFNIANENELNEFLLTIVKEKIDYFESKKFTYHKNILLLEQVLSF